VNGNNGGFGRVVGSIGRLTTGQQLFRFNVSTYSDSSGTFDNLRQKLMFEIGLNQVRSSGFSDGFSALVVQLLT